MNSQALDRFFDGTYLLIEIACKLLLLTMVLVISYTVFGRFVLNRTPTWGESLSIFCMVWLAILGSSLAVRDGRHIRMTIIDFVVPPRVAIVLHKLAYVIVFAVGVACILGGIALFELFSGSIIGALGISSKWLALALPVGGVVHVLMFVARLRRGGWEPTGSTE
ncbi:MAG: TRAP transporter small permease [Spirochaeta sp.]|jgi:TRAP-type C4-dicarboxylate transport system permease small subunit|nr:TRAP transporter small permease [Spirochaeta sp.]